MQIDLERMSQEDKDPDLRLYKDDQKIGSTMSLRGLLGIRLPQTAGMLQPPISGGHPRVPRARHATGGLVFRSRWPRFRFGSLV